MPYSPSSTPTLPDAPPVVVPPARANHAFDPQLDAFLRQVLPPLVRKLRKLRTWKGFDARRHQDLVDDLRQELIVDCLEHATEIAALPASERQVRWLRLIERRHYDLRVRGARRTANGALPDGVALDACALEQPESPPVRRLPGIAAVATVVSSASARAVREGDAAELAAFARAAEYGGCSGFDQLLQQLWRAGDHLGNGRINVEATAAKVGLTPRELRRLWADTAARLGYDDEFLCFWRRRLCEALTGLAADLLRDGGALRLWEERRNRPDPSGRLRRVRRIRAVVSIRPLPVDMRAALARCGRVSMPRLCPRELLAAAEVLCPDNAAVQAWRFEAEIAAGEVRAAARALRAARRLGAEVVSMALARARLAEVQGREDRALAILLRAAWRHPRDARLMRAVAALRQDQKPCATDRGDSRVDTSAASSRSSSSGAAPIDVHSGTPHQSVAR